jgi:glycosyltransferase involved in cell wall biosynthesis
MSSPSDRTLEAGGSGPGTPVVSVAVCTWNGETWIRRQLQSILDQDRPVDEVVVFDDRSTDSTPEIVRQMASGSSIPIRLHVNRTNLGSTGNFQEAIRACQGDVVFLSDQDDVWMASKVSSVLGRFQDRPEVRWMFTDGELIDEAEKKLPGSLWGKYAVRRSVLRAFRKDPLETLLRRPIVTGATFACFRDELVDCLPVPADWVHDHWISLHLAARGISGDFIEDNLIRYRVHSNQQIGVKLTGVKALAEKSAKVKGDDYLREVDRMGQLVDSLRKTPLALAGIDHVGRKIDHFKARSGIHSAGILKGLSIVLRELAKDRYRYSWSKYAFVLDLARILVLPRKSSRT